MDVIYRVHTAAIGPLETAIVDADGVAHPATVQALVVELVPAAERDPHGAVKLVVAPGHAPQGLRQEASKLFQPGQLIRASFAAHEVAVAERAEG